MTEERRWGHGNLNVGVLQAEMLEVLAGQLLAHVLLLIHPSVLADVKTEIAPQIHHQTEHTFDWPIAVFDNVTKLPFIIDRGKITFGLHAGVYGYDDLYLVSCA